MEAAYVLHIDFSHESYATVFMIEVIACDYFNREFKAIGSSETSILICEIRFVGSQESIISALLNMTSCIFYLNLQRSLTANLKP